MKPPRVRLTFWENKIPHWGVCHRPDGCTPQKKSTTQGEVDEEEEEAWPPGGVEGVGEMEERVLEEEEVVREGGAKS